MFAKNDTRRTLQAKAWADKMKIDLNAMFPDGLADFVAALKAAEKK